MSKKRLGRGLDALLSAKPSSSLHAAREGPTSSAETATENASDLDHSGVAMLSITAISPSPFQPRRVFDEETLQELASSIKHQGLLQPIVVRQKVQGGYELIAGERRWRAAKMAGLTKLQAVIKSVTDAEASALALIENMQREDLNALEEALGLARLRDEFELTQQQIANAVGKSRAAIANLLRLLNLGSTARNLLECGDLEMGHARALLAITGFGQDQLAQQVVEDGLSVRQTEALVRRAVAGVKTKVTPRAVMKDADTQRLEMILTDQIGAPVSIKHGTQGKGELTIKYSSLDELDGVLKHLGIESS